MVTGLEVKFGLVNATWNLHTNKPHRKINLGQQYENVLSSDLLCGLRST